MVRFNTQLAPTLWPPRPPPTRFLVREQVLDANAYELSVEPRLTDHFLPGSEEPGSGPGESAAQSDAPTPDRASDEATPVRDDLCDADLPIPDPADDVDALEELEEEITTLAAHIHAATHRLLILIADFDRRRGWELGGHRTCAHWLSFRTGIDLGAAREKVRTARVLVGLPLTSASMARGELSFSKVRALSRVATEVNEKELLPFAQECTTAHLERMVRGFKRGSRKDEAALERERHESRALSVFPDDEGMYVIKGRLPAEVGALVMRAVEAASDALYREKREPRLETDTEREKAAAQRRADALGLLAERALAVGFGGKNREVGSGEGGEEGGEAGSRDAMTTKPTTTPFPSAAAGPSGFR